MSDLSSREMPAATAIDSVLPDGTGRRAWISESFEREIGEGRGFLWLPVLFGVGILVYLNLPTEPSAIAVVAVTLAPALLAWESRRHVRLFRLTITVFLVAGGTATMKLRTDMVAEPKLPREMTAAVTGWVAERQTASRGGVRVVLRVAEMERLAPEETPDAVRVTIRAKSQTLSVGDAIAVTARLRPPNGPVIPGGYDFAMAAYYQRIGAVGFAYGAARPADLGPAPLDIRLYEPLERLREAIGARVTAALPGDRGRVATALITGDRGGISEATQEAMRAMFPMYGNVC